MDTEDRPRKIQKLDEGVEMPFPASKPSASLDALIDHAVVSDQRFHDTRTDADLGSGVITKVDVRVTGTGESMNATGGLNSSISAPTNTTTDTPLSKNQQKKLARQQKFDEEAPLRRAIRKRKKLEKRERNRASKVASTAALDSDPSNITATASSVIPKKDHIGRVLPVLLPLTLVIDCAFDEFMIAKERLSLCSQVTRAYSDNRNALYRVNLVVSSYGGSLKKRLEGVLSNMHLSWKGVTMTEKAFVEAAKEAGKVMEEQRMPTKAGALLPASEERAESDKVVYLSSDSTNTLSSLEPFTTYVIGGIVDKNRHKGLCQKRALDNGIKTARLPISEYLHMSGRTVLTTNHVVEIMLKWLETGNWAEAFMKVIPTRKGVTLRNETKVASAEMGASDGASRSELSDHDVVEEGSMLGAETETRMGELETTVRQKSPALEGFGTSAGERSIIGAYDIEPDASTNAATKL